MSREKQTEIEEIAIVIDQAEHDMWNGKGDFIHHSETIAKYLYNADYRKQSEGHWIENEDDFWVMCSECGTEFLDDQIGIVETYKYCPNCGAKMKGGAE